MDATYSAEEHFRLGRELLGTGGDSEALEHFRAAHELDRDNARFASYYGLALALVERRFNRAVELPLCHPTLLPVLSVKASTTGLTKRSLRPE